MKTILDAIVALATAGALIVSIIALIVSNHTFRQTFDAQEKFNRDQIGAMNKGLQLQKEAAEAEHAAAKAQREASAVEALGRYLANAPKENQAWAASEAIIDMVGDDPAWQATARRAIRHHPENLAHLESSYIARSSSNLLPRPFVSQGTLCAIPGLGRRTAPASVLRSKFADKAASDSRISSAGLGHRKGVWRGDRRDALIVSGVVSGQV
jgi:hypothetical protein